MSGLPQRCHARAMVNKRLTDVVSLSANHSGQSATALKAEKFIIFIYHKWQK